MKSLSDKKVGEWMERFYYSEETEGNASNYHWKVSFDKSTSGYVGITQTHEDSHLERVLLTPRQVKEMIAFIKRRMR